MTEEKITTEERVSQAVAERLDMLTELKARQEASVKAAGDRSKVRSNRDPAEAVEKLETAFNEIHATSSNTWEKERTKAQADYDSQVNHVNLKHEEDLVKASESLATAEARVKETYDNRVGIAQESLDKAVAVIKKKQQSADTAVTSRAHVAEMAAVDQLADVEIQRIRVQKALGIDLAVFVNLPEDA